MTFLKLSKRIDRAIGRTAVDHQILKLQTSFTDNLHLQPLRGNATDAVSSRILSTLFQQTVMLRI